jgi:hypothetical protein
VGRPTQVLLTTYPCSTQPWPASQEGAGACGPSAWLLARLPLQLPPSSVWLGQCTMAGLQDAPMVMVWSMCSSGTAGHAGSGGQEGADCQGQGCTQHAAHHGLVLWWRRCDAGGRFWCPWNKVAGAGCRPTTRSSRCSTTSLTTTAATATAGGEAAAAADQHTTWCRSATYHLFDCWETEHRVTRAV